MLNVYLGSLGVGGTLVLLTVLMGGGQGDLDFDADVPDVDMDADVGFGDAIEGWLPVASFRFWTFFLAFFGLTGLLLTITGALSLGWVPWVAGGMGYVAGASTTKIIRSLQNKKVNSQLSTHDWLGEEANVVIPLSKGQLGTVRLNLKGREIIVEAVSDVALNKDAAVVVYDINKDGYAMVEPLNKLSE